MKKGLSLLLVLVLAIGLGMMPAGALAANAQGVTDDSVTIANSIALSGPYAPVGIPFKWGIDAYLKIVNDNGGVNGRQIKYIHTDDEFSPEKGKAAFEKFLYDDKVFAIVGHFGTPVVAATLDDMKEAGIPTIYYATGIRQLAQAKAEGNDRSSMPIQPIYSSEGQVMVAYAKGYFEAKTLGVVYTNDDAGKSILEGVELAAKELGLELVVEALEAGATDATAAVAKIKDTDLVIGAMIQATLPTLLKEMEKQDVMLPVVTTYVNVSATITFTNAEHIQKLIHTEGAGVYGLGWVDVILDHPEYIRYAEGLKAAGAPDDANNTYAMTGWIAASAFVQGLERIPADADLTWEAYIDAVESAPIINPFGGEVDFANGARLGTTAMNLSKMDDTKEGVGWYNVFPITSMADILANQK